MTCSAGKRLRTHLWTACGEISKARATTVAPPARLIASLTADSIMLALNKPQVEANVNLWSVEPLNQRFHRGGMSPVGKVITARLEQLQQTQAWLAERVGVSENAVSKWIMSGKISRANSIKTALALDISLAQLLQSSPTPDLDERWHVLPAALKARLLDIVDELAARNRQPERPTKRRA